MYTLHKCIPVSKSTSIKLTILIVFIDKVKELNEEYFTTIKRFVYISVIIKLNFETPKLDKF